MSPRNPQNTINPIAAVRLRCVYRFGRMLDSCSIRSAAGSDCSPSSAPIHTPRTVSQDGMIESSPRSYQAMNAVLAIGVKLWPSKWQILWLSVRHRTLRRVCNMKISGFHHAIGFCKTGEALLESSSALPRVPIQRLPSASSPSERKGDCLLSPLSTDSFHTPLSIRTPALCGNHIRPSVDWRKSRISSFL